MRSMSLDLERSGGREIDDGDVWDSREDCENPPLEVGLVEAFLCFSEPLFCRFLLNVIQTKWLRMGIS